MKCQECGSEIDLESVKLNVTQRGDSIEIELDCPECDTTHWAPVKPEAFTIEDAPGDDDDTDDEFGF